MIITAANNFVGGIRDRMRWELAGGDLIQEWREEVIVLPVDERDRRLAAMKPPFQSTDEMQAREPAPEHDDLLGGAQFGSPDAASTRSSSAM